MAALIRPLALYQGDPIEPHVGLVVDKAASGQVFSWFYSSVHSFQQLLHQASVVLLDKDLPSHNETKSGLAVPTHIQFQK